MAGGEQTVQGQWEWEERASNTAGCSHTLARAGPTKIDPDQPRPWDRNENNHFANGRTADHGLFPADLDCPNTSQTRLNVSGTWGVAKLSVFLIWFTGKPMMRVSWSRVVASEQTADDQPRSSLMLSRRDDSKSKHFSLSSSYHSVVFLRWCSPFVFWKSADASFWTCVHSWPETLAITLACELAFVVTEATQPPAQASSGPPGRHRASRFGVWNGKVSTEQLKRRLPYITAMSKGGAARVKPDGGGTHAIPARPCANPSEEEARRGYYRFCLFAGETTEIISQAQDWDRQSSRPIQRGIAAPEGAVAPVETGEFQTKMRNIKKKKHVMFSY